jgi:hypothetical protein
MGSGSGTALVFTRKSRTSMEGRTGEAHTLGSSLLKVCPLCSTVPVWMPFAWLSSSFQVKVEGFGLTNQCLFTVCLISKIFLGFLGDTLRDMSPHIFFFFFHGFSFWMFFSMPIGLERMSSQKSIYHAPPPLLLAHFS